MNKKLILIICLINLNIYSQFESSWPYLSGDTFRSFCKYVIDATNNKIPVNEIKTGDTIFVHPPHLEYFFNTIHPYIKYPYILITNNDDMTIPGRFMHYLNDPRLGFWFAQNNNIKHPKLITIPLGIMNETLIPWCKKAIGNVPGHRVTVEKILSEINTKQPSKDILLYMNFDIHAGIPERRRAHDYFRNKKFCIKSPRTPLDSYLRDITRSKFVLSPKGVGFDCIRTWETLYVKSFPLIVTEKYNYFYELYKDLPVLLVDKIEKITDEFLEKKYKEMVNTKYNYEKLYAPYWLKLIRCYQTKLRSKN